MNLHFKLGVQSKEYTMKRIAVSLFLLCCIAVLPVYNVSARQGGNCTNYGCMYVESMSQVLTSGGGGQGCVWFPHGPTGRKLRNSQGFQGGDPVAIGGTQTIRYSYNACNTCVPPAGNGIATEGLWPGDFGLPQRFGLYDCE